MERLGTRRACAAVAMVALTALSVPAGGALPPRDGNERLFMSEGEQVLLALAQREGLTDVRIIGTFSFFSCGYGCRADEDVIIFTATDRRSRVSGELAVCYDRDAQRISEASGRMSEHPSCRYSPADGDPPGNPGTEAP